jgi:hypothetical protein
LSVSSSNRAGHLPTVIKDLNRIAVKIVGCFHFKKSDKVLQGNHPARQSQILLELTELPLGNLGELTILTTIRCVMCCNNQTLSINLGQEVEDLGICKLEQDTKQQNAWSQKHMYLAPIKLNVSILEHGDAVRSGAKQARFRTKTLFSQTQSYARVSKLQRFISKKKPICILMVTTSAVAKQQAMARDPPTGSCSRPGWR